jgi:rRNA-processing protein FCF1
MSWKRAVPTVSLAHLASRFPSGCDLYDLRLLHPKAEPWVLYDHVSSKANAATAECLMQWTKRVGELGNTAVRTAALSQGRRIIDSSIDAGTCSDVALWQFWSLCEMHGDVDAAFEMLARATHAGLVNTPLHYLGLLRVAESCADDSDAGAAAVSIAAFCSENRVWSAELRAGFLAMHGRLGELSSELADFCNRGIPTLDRDTGGVAISPRFPSLLDPSRSHLGLQLRGARGDSELLEDFIEPPARELLIRAAARSDVSTVMTLASQVRANRQLSVGGGKKRSHHDELHRLLASNTAFSSQVTPDLYHYIIAAMRHGHPSLVLRTLDKMIDCGFDPLDSTLVSGIAAVGGDPHSQQRLFDTMWDRIEERATNVRRSHDQGADSPLLASYWHLDAPQFLQHANAMTKEAFLSSVGKNVGTAALLRLLSTSLARSCSHAPTPSALVTTDEAIAAAVAHTMKTDAANSRLHDAIDVFEEQCPELNVALCGRLRGFWDYAPARNFAHGSEQLRELLAALLKRVPLRDAVDRTIAVLDGSFAECHPDFATFFNESDFAVLVPQAVLDDLDRTARDGAVLADARGRATDALNGIRHLVDDPGIAAELLHFSECLPFVAKPSISVEDVNSILIATAEVVATMVGAGAKVLICTEDPTLLHHAERAGIPTLSRRPDPHAPSLPANQRCVVDIIPHDFEPRLGTSSPRTPVPSEAPTDAVVAPESSESAPKAAGSWLDLLDD